MIKVAVLGATGYTALEAIKILLRHPQAEIVAVTSRQEGNTPVSSVHPSLVGRLDRPLEDLTPEQVGSRAECVFSCLPHCASAEIIPKVLAAGAKVIDFSADYRLDDAATYLEWYGHEHPDAEPARGQTVYGLPELFRSRIKGRVARRQPRVLLDVGDSCRSPRCVKSGLFQTRRRDHRFQERRERRRPLAEADDALSLNATKVCRPTTWAGIGTRRKSSR
jgi:hypothetical protein